jgi:hypothetical protein
MASKITKAQNPFGVKKGQVWYGNDPRRKNRNFTVIGLNEGEGSAYAEVEYPTTKKVKGSTRYIRLDCFGRYRKVSD